MATTEKVTTEVTCEDCGVVIQNHYDGPKHDKICMKKEGSKKRYKEKVRAEERGESLVDPTVRSRRIGKNVKKKVQREIKKEIKKKKSDEVEE